MKASQKRAIDMWETDLGEIPAVGGVMPDGWGQRASWARRSTANARSDQRGFFGTQKRLFRRNLAFMPEGQPLRVRICEPLEVVAFQSHGLGLYATVMMMAVAVVLPVVVGMSRWFLMPAAGVHGHVLRFQMGMIRTNDADIQAGHHAKNHYP